MIEGEESTASAHQSSESRGMVVTIVLVFGFILAFVLSAWTAVELFNGGDPSLAFSGSKPPSAISAYSKLADSPCVNALNAYGTIYFSEFSNPIAAFVREKDSSFRNTTNIDSYFLTLCRLNEGNDINKVVDELLARKKLNRLPAIPFGGSSVDPRVLADFGAFRRWIHHAGPRPTFSGSVEDVRLMSWDENIVVALNASTCSLRSGEWFKNLRSAWDYYSDDIIQEDDISSGDANALLEKVRSDVQNELGFYPAICKSIANSRHLDDLDKMERRWAAGVR